MNICLKLLKFIIINKKTLIVFFVALHFDLNIMLIIFLLIHSIFDHIFKKFLIFYLIITMRFMNYLEIF